MIGKTLSTNKVRGLRRPGGQVFCLLTHSSCQHIYLGVWDGVGFKVHSEVSSLGGWAYCEMANPERGADLRMKIMSLSFGGLRDYCDIQIDVRLEEIHWVSGDGKKKKKRWGSRI